MKNFLLWVIAMTVITACSLESEIDQKGSVQTRSGGVASLEVDATIMKLKDDTTSLVAGVLGINAPGQEVSVKWNVPPDCNIDTTQTALQLEDGKAHLPIKWTQCLRGQNHGPENMAFEGGVIVATPEEAKYVRLLWADRIDSVYFAENPILMDNPQADAPDTKSFSIYPLVLNLNIEIGGSMQVMNEEHLYVRMDLNEITPDLNIDLSSINPDGEIEDAVQKTSILTFKWTDAGAPLFSFTRPIYFDANGITKTAYLNYKVNSTTPFYRFISALPDLPGYVSAQNGYVTVTVETNKEWSIESAFSADSPVEDKDASGLKPRTKVIRIDDNPGPGNRTIQIIIKSQGEVKETIDIVQKGPGAENKFEYDHDNMPTPLPKAGGEYTFTFKGDNPGTVQVKALVEGNTIGVSNAVPAPGVDVNIVITENADAASRNITFQYSVDGNVWVPLPNATNREQLGTDGGGETPYLEYVSNTLPAGNIPQPGELYSFKFRGTYQGRLRVRAITDGTNYLGDMANAGNWDPSITVPANPATAVRAVRFQYRPFDATDAALNKWTDFPNGGITKNQDAGTTAGTVTAGPLTPEGPIKDDGGKYSCIFTGDYTGDIFMRAMDGNVELGSSSGKINTSISIDIPKIVGPNRTVTFQYSLDGNAPWTHLDAREQKHETVIYGSIEPTGDIPYGGKTYTMKISGTFTKKITVRAREGNSAGPVIAEETSTISPEGHTFKLVIPQNPRNVARAVGFSYIREDQTKETLIVIKNQKEK